ncbi:MAG: hypothetical protein AAB036_05570 [Elusimicrobiota bacterium]
MNKDYKGIERRSHDRGATSAPRRLFAVIIAAAVLATLLAYWLITRL